MANRRSTMEDTFNMRIAHPFALCPVFTLLDASKQRLRLRLQRRALSLFAQQTDMIYLNLQKATIDGYWINITAFDSVVGRVHDNADQLPIYRHTCVSPSEWYTVGSIDLQLAYDTDAQTLTLKQKSQLMSFDCSKLESFKMVQNGQLVSQLTKLQNHQTAVQTGLISMDSKHRLMVERWDTRLPVIGVWLRGDLRLSSLQTYQNAVKFVKGRYAKKCSLDEQATSFILMLLTRHGIEVHLATLKDTSETSVSETIQLDIREEVVEFGADPPDVSGMQFTLRDKSSHSIDFYSPIKSLDTQRMEQDLIKIEQRVRDSPDFTHYDSEKEELRNRVEQQDQEISKLREEVAMLRRELQKSFERSTHKKSLIRSPQYELFSSRVVTPERLEQSDLKVYDSSKAAQSSKGSTNNTKRSDQFLEDLSQFRRARKVIMETRENEIEEGNEDPWDQMELIEQQ